MLKKDKDKFAAFCWAYEEIKNPKQDWVILDTETTGLGDQDEIVDIAIISKYGSAIVNTLVKPTISIPTVASNIHKITDADVADAPSFAEVYPLICKAIEGKKVIIYNSAFDISKLKYCCQKHGLKMPEFKTECLMLWYSQYVGEWNGYYQNYRWQKLPGGNHRAIGDAIASYKLLARMALPLSTTARIQPPLFPPNQIFCEWRHWIEVKISIDYVREFNLEIKRPHWHRLTPEEEAAGSDSWVPF